MTSSPLGRACCSPRLLRTKPGAARRRLSLHLHSYRGQADMMRSCAFMKSQQANIFPAMILYLASRRAQTHVTNHSQSCVLPQGLTLIKSKAVAATAPPMTTYYRFDTETPPGSFRRPRPLLPVVYIVWFVGVAMRCGLDASRSSSVCLGARSRPIRRG